MARSAEGLPTKPKRKPKKKLRYPKKGPRPGNHKGGAPKGNEFWKFAMQPRRTKDYTPPELAARAVEYFQWVEANPLTRDTGGGKYQDVGRPYTIDAFCIFAGITRTTFNNYSEGVGYQDYFSVCEDIRTVIKNQKYEGAAVGKFNAAIIARDLGLVDRQERDIGNKGGQPFQSETKVNAEITVAMDEKTASQLYRSMMNPPKQEA